jgi:hypothetical protein
LHHLDETEKQESLREVARVLTPGGRLVIGDMMFRISLRSARDRAVVLGIVRRLLRRGPAGMLRLVRNGLRVIVGRAEHPASVDWWQQALADTSFTHISVQALSHEGGLAYARRPPPAQEAPGNLRTVSPSSLATAGPRRPTVRQQLRRSGQTHTWET